MQIKDYNLQLIKGYEEIRQILDDASVSQDPFASEKALISISVLVYNQLRELQDKHPLYKGMSEWN